MCAARPSRSFVDGRPLLIAEHMAGQLTGAAGGGGGGVAAAHRQLLCVPPRAGRRTAVSAAPLHPPPSSVHPHTQCCGWARLGSISIDSAGLGRRCSADVPESADA